MATLSPKMAPTSPTKKSSMELLPELPVISQPESHSRKPQANPAGGDEVDAEGWAKEEAHRRPSQVKTPELQTEGSNPSDQTPGHSTDDQRSPGHIPNFDWDEFENRYERALAESNEQEKELLEEFDRLVKYFNVWASAAAAHDNERAVKRLQTRQRYVKIAEQSLDQKKQHLTEVVRAFRSALALLGSQS